MAKTFYADTIEKLNAIDIVPGQMLFCEEDNSIHIDNANGVRVNYANVIDLETESERESLQNPTKAIYFVIETTTLYKYNNEWIPIMSGSGEEDVVYRNSVEDLPYIGVSRKLYCVGTDLYRWQNGRYSLMTSSDPVWGEF